MSLSLSGCDPREWFVCSLGACSVELDERAPFFPQGLTATPGDRQATLRWTANTEPDLFTYDVHRSTTPGGPYTKVGSTFDTILRDPDTRGSANDLVNGTTYYYVVNVSDTAGNVSGFSNEVSVTPRAGPSVERPGRPTLTARPDYGGEIELDWDSPPRADRYHLARSTTAGGPYQEIEATILTSYRDRGLSPGTTYYYVVTAENENGELSEPSNEVSGSPYAVPGPFFTYLTGWGSAGQASGQFNQPVGIATDSSGNVYVTDQLPDSTARVQKFTGDGAFDRFWTYGGTAGGIAVDSDDDVYVVDRTGNRVIKFTSTGGFIRQWGGLGSGAEQLRAPAGIATGPGANVYVADTGNLRIQRFDIDGLPRSRWAAGAAPGGPVGVTSGEDGNVYVTDTGGHRVQKFTSTGAPLLEWGSPGAEPGQFNTPTGVEVDPANRVFVADRENARTQVFSTDGFLNAVIGQGTGNRPTAVTSDCRANVFVLDAGRSMVDKYGDPNASPPPCTGAPTAPGFRRRDPVFAAAVRNRFQATLKTTGSTAGRMSTAGGKTRERGSRARGTFTGKPRGGSRVPRGLRALGRGSWYALFDITMDPKTFKGGAKGYAVAAARQRKAGRLCVSFDMTLAVTGAKVDISGKFKTRGGSGALGKVSAQGTYTQRLQSNARITVSGTARGGGRPPRRLPAGCRRVLKAFNLR